MPNQVCAGETWPLGPARPVLYPPSNLPSPLLYSYAPGLNIAVTLDSHPVPNPFRHHHPIKIRQLQFHIKI